MLGTAAWCRVCVRVPGANASAHRAITNASRRQSQAPAPAAGGIAAAQQGRRPGCEHHLLTQPRARGSEHPAPASAPPGQAQPGGQLSSARSALYSLPLPPARLLGATSGTSCPGEVNAPIAGESHPAAVTAATLLALSWARVTGWDRDSGVLLMARSLPRESCSSPPACKTCPEIFSKGRAFGTFLTCQERPKPTRAGEGAPRTAPPATARSVFGTRLCRSRGQSQKAVPAALLSIRSSVPPVPADRFGVRYGATGEPREG